MADHDYPQVKKIDVISGARVLSEGWDPTVQHDIYIEGSEIKNIAPHLTSASSHTSKKVLDARNCLIAPSLCHAHIHLDKCFLLSDPKFADLEIVKGDFAEAMEITAKAKARFDKDDLLRRGTWLIAESIAAGVTHMRAFVEVDHIVHMKCLNAAIDLKRKFAAACTIQICAFAQEPIYSGTHGDANRELMEAAVFNEHVSVVGTTPYVENNEETLKKNIGWAMKMGSDCNIHLDFHLDYNLDGSKNAQTDFVAKRLQSMSLYQRIRSSAERLTVVLSHCTRLTMYDEPEWQALSQCVQHLELYFVGLPTSDLYMMGKPRDHEGGGERVRGTLQIPQMIQRYGIRGAIAINNVGNAFTPYGSCDPLSIASMGVGLYHAGTKKDARMLYECVSGRAMEAIGYSSRPFMIGEPATFVLFDMRGSGGSLLSTRRERKSLQEVLFDPPKGRKTILKGHLITT
ncbi:hypothetical protein IMSHALPRED_003381 [Imshaugia aleurites]|uniref:Amidohydrolase-related domain-containing protein n=1 Tax=Imshaugia aleurites TaxID=172621 RepID=A0A8H3J7M7_9LECA|nr:hypothetical protein IMSHALPRED_003381 [Imshaugia aleurites]